MSDRATLKQVVAEFLETSPETIQAGFLLRHPRFHGSAGKGLLAAAIHRKLGVYSNEVFSARTYGELEAVFFEGQESAGEIVAVPAARLGAPDQGSSTLGLRVGVDVEMVENMPDVPDFWTAAFYRSHFSPAEIAYCLRQDQPRVHFAARWCAKEALAKCDARFAGVDPATIQVAHREGGQPVLEALNGDRVNRIACAVSLSHTPLMAVAVVVAGAQE